MLEWQQHPTHGATTGCDKVKPSYEQSSEAIRQHLTREEPTEDRSSIGVVPYSQP